MSRRSVSVSILALAAACATKPGADGPAGVVAELYEPYLEGSNTKGLLESAPWTSEMRALLVRAMELSDAQGEPNPVVDFDPIVGAQDWQLSKLDVNVAGPITGDRVDVVSRFTNVDEQFQQTFAMKQEGGAWRVDNISGADWNLRAMLTELGITP